MKLFILTLVSLLGLTAAAQSNPFAPDSPEHRLYELYLSCAGPDCAQFAAEASACFDRNPKPIMATELLYNFFLSNAYYSQEDFGSAEVFAKRNQALLAEYDRRKVLFWEEEDYRYLHGMDQLDLAKLLEWNERATGNKALPSAPTICPACPVFPFPPPQASAENVLDRNLFRQCQSLADVSQKIATALDSCEYEKRFYAVPGGFAIVARLEQFDRSNAISLAPPARWSVAFPPLRNFSDYFSALIFGQEGSFRIIVFIVTDQPFSQNARLVSREEGVSWLRGGLNVLPEAFEQIAWTNHFNCTALIYEFKVTSAQGKAQLVDNSRFPVRTHLKMARILQYLKASGQ